MVALGERILFTAHEVKTARAQFLRLVSFFEDKRYPELSRMVKQIRRTNGQEGIELRNGGRVDFIARSKSSGRGFSTDLILADESQHFSALALASLLPTVSASRNRQVIYVGTVPGPSAEGEVFTKLRASALEGSNPRVCWLEWAAPEGSDLDSVEVWKAANPAAGIRLEVETIADERAAMDDETFMRERLGMWIAKSTGAVIDPESWRLLADGTSQVLDPIAVAVDISPDRSQASIAIAGARRDGLYHVEIVDNRRGTDWLAPRLAALVAQWGPCVVIADGPAATVIPELDHLGVPVVRTTLSEFGLACGLFYDYVYSARLRHVNQPILSESVDVARKRPVGDLWAWGRKDSTADITPTVAVTLALYGFLDARPARRRLGRGGGKVLVL
ncbi:hypothetical protein D5S18_03035 [Nocardia panacis]|uniref:Terminase n=2 Tax=Nocardia panacis TaxID=2340916 RepID=A0A3A4KVQ4_9NOCA|nr:hypothetical protein D5S18_03035 [Nocardia panacis]